MKPLRVAIEARLQDGVAGGVQQVVVGLAQGLSRLEGPEEYCFHVYPDSCGWLEPYLRGPCRRLDAAPMGRLVRSSRLKDALRPLMRGGALGLWLAKATRRLPVSDGRIEAEGCEAVHFPYQAAFKTEVPSVYQPHDLQHRHYPEFFSAGERYWRDLSYSAWCRQATVAVMMTHWGRQDLVREFGLDPGKVAVVEGGSVTTDYPALPPQALADLLGRLGLVPGEPFLLYPAQAFPHKNHLLLLDALALLRSRRGRAVKLVCTGGEHPHLKVVLARRRQLDLVQEVAFAGFLSGAELKALYRSAMALVFPSLFEGWGLPVTEAFQEGLPVACARATSLPEHAGGAALLFDPGDPLELAACLERLMDDPALRQSLAEKGRQRSASMTWEGAARVFRAHYRRLAGRELSEEDRALVEASFSDRSSTEG